MNIAIVLPYLKAGGTERQASYIANDLSEKGHNVTVVCIEQNIAFRDLFKVPVEYLNSKNSIFKLLANIKDLAATLVRLKIDVVLSRAWSVNLLTSRAAKNLNIPSVLFLSGSLNLSKHSWLKKIIHKNTLNNASDIISVSNKAKQNCLKWLDTDEHKITVIHNGVDLDSIQRKSNSKDVLSENFLAIKTPKVVFVGRLIHRKGLDLLLKSISDIKKSGRYVNLIVVGDGDGKSTYIEMSKNLGISECVHFVGEQTNPFPFMKLSDVFVLPSRSEGFPNVLLEAMALGLPVVASNCETGPDEILNGKNGLLASTNSSNSLRNNIIKLLDNNLLRNELGKQGQVTIEKSFKLKNQLSKIEKVIVKSSCM